MWNWKNQGNEPGSEGGALNLVLIPYYQGYTFFVNKCLRRIVGLLHWRDKVAIKEL